MERVVVESIFLTASSLARVIVSLIVSPWYSWKRRSASRREMPRSLTTSATVIPLTAFWWMKSSARAMRCAAGAALATVFAQAISVILSLLVIMRRKLPFTFRKEQLRFDRPLTAGILRLGVPIALQDVLVGVSFLVILAIVNSLGLLQSAGMGIAEKVCAFVMLLPSAFSQSVSAFVAQNTGAGKPERAKKALRCGVIVSLCISVFVFYFNFFHGDLLAGIFANDRAVILEAADYLKAYAIDCLLTSFLFCFVGYFSGLGKTVFVMAQGILGAFGVRIPVSFAMSRLPNVRLFYIGLATPCSTVVQVILCLAYYAHLSRREKSGPAV